MRKEWLRRIISVFHREKNEGWKTFGLPKMHSLEYKLHTVSREPKPFRSLGSGVFLATDFDDWKKRVGKQKTRPQTLAQVKPHVSNIDRLIWWWWQFKRKMNTKLRR